MQKTAHAPVADATLVARVLERLAEDLSTMMGHELVLGPPRIERATTRPAGPGQVHVSFKLGFAGTDGTQRFGALLFPLPDALTMACYLLMIPEESLPIRRAQSGPNSALKHALLEIGNMIGTAGQTALAAAGVTGWSMAFEGCQGVRADVRPAFPYDEGSTLLVARTPGRLGSFPAFELLLMLPLLD